MAPVTVVADTGPIIALAKVDQLAVLDTLFGSTAIPVAVMHELLAKRSSESRRIRHALSTFVATVPVAEPSLRVRLATQNLDLGEAEAVALASQYATPLLIDDANGRKAARQLGITVIGTVGILLRAKEIGQVPQALSLLFEMRRQGYWFSDDLLMQASVLAGERFLGGRQSTANDD